MLRVARPGLTVPAVAGRGLSEWLGRTARRRSDSEPHVSDTPAIWRQILPLVEAVEVTDGHLRNRSWLRQPQVHGYSAFALVIWLQAAPVGHATALWAEVKLERVTPHVALGFTGEVNVFSFPAIRPQHAIATASGATACSSGLGHVSVLPSDLAAETGAFEHCNLS